jgi:hypothetical protein
MFLWVQIRAGRWKKDRFNVRMSCQHVRNRLPFVPIGTVSEQQNRLTRIARKQVAQKGSRLDAVHLQPGQQAMHKS